MTPERAAAVILAAGYSDRMGRFKPLLPLGGRPLVAHGIDLFRRCGIAEIHVVVGHRWEELLPLLTGTGVDVVVNGDFRRGMFSSVRAGVERLSTDCRAFFMLPADIPPVRPATVQSLLDRFEDDRVAIAYPRFLHRRGHPPLIGRQLAPRILAGDGGLRALLARHEHAALDVPVADRHILHDADHPSDHAALQATWPRRDIPDEAECRAVMEICGPVANRVQGHCRAVARTALALTDALRRAGCSLDNCLIQAAALLHDISRGERDHARVGAERLRRLGLDPVAEIVARHHDLTVDLQGDVDETEVVYLADKLVVEDRVVALEERFRRALDRYGRSAGARAGIRRRRDQARMVQGRVEARAGRSVEEILETAGEGRAGACEP